MVSAGKQGSARSPAIPVGSGTRAVAFKSNPSNVQPRRIPNRPPCFVHPAQGKPGSASPPHAPRSRASHATTSPDDQRLETIVATTSPIVSPTAPPEPEEPCPDGPTRSDRDKARTHPLYSSKQATRQSSTAAVTAQQPPRRDHPGKRDRPIPARSPAQGRRTPAPAARESPRDRPPGLSPTRRIFEPLRIETGQEAATSTPAKRPQREARASVPNVSTPHGPSRPGPLTHTSGANRNGVETTSESSSIRIVPVEAFLARLDSSRTST